MEHWLKIPMVSVRCKLCADFNFPVKKVVHDPYRNFRRYS